MLYPASGAENIDPLVVKVTIRPATEADRHDVEINTEPDFSGDGQLIKSVQDFQTTFIIKGLKPSTTYYARVRREGSEFGSVSQFTTRPAIQRLRLWGLTTNGGTEGRGTIFSYSIDDNAFLKNYDNEFVPYYYDSDSNYYAITLSGTLIPGPEDTFYGHAEHPYTDHLFTLTADGHVDWWPDEVYFTDANMLLGSDNHLYASSQHELGPGVIDRHSVAKKDFQRIREFDDSRYGDDPGAPLVELPDGNLYGAAATEGVNEGGLLFAMKHDGSGFEVIHYFDNVSGGMNPYSGLALADGFFYGTTAHGGVKGNLGTIYRVKPDGSSFAKLHDFGGTDGREPLDEALVVENVIYGMTTRGGIADMGVIYSLNTDGTSFRILHEFSGEDGRRPTGALVADHEGYLYGMTYAGGVNDLGVLFRIPMDGTTFTKLFDFSPESGGNPNGSLCIREDTYPAASAITLQSDAALVPVSVHPNPSADNFEVHVDAQGDIPVKLVVTDQYGQYVTTYTMAAGSSTVELGRELKRGVYILKIIHQDTILVKRLVKE
ncbi:MAG TPA: choice-of-anchor tandem repeat GloVer-containing protein [Chryseosolibacter sp.]